MIKRNILLDKIAFNFLFQVQPTSIPTKRSRIFNENSFSTIVCQHQHQHLSSHRKQARTNKGFYDALTIEKLRCPKLTLINNFASFANSSFSGVKICFFYCQTLPLVALTVVNYARGPSPQPKKYAGFYHKVF